MWEKETEGVTERKIKRKIKRKIGVGGRETGMGENDRMRDRSGRERENNK